MAADSQNFELSQGDALQVNFTITPNTGVSLLGCQLFWSCFATLLGAVQTPATLRKWLGSGLQIDDPTAQTFHITLAPNDTLTLASGNYYHEVVLIDASGNPSTVTTGLMSLLDRATTDFTT